MERILVILGMHRSGTSLVTQWLYRCGLNVGNRLLAASIGNAEGHFEDEDFLALHREWLIKRNLVCTGLIHQTPAPLQEEEIQQLRTLLTKKSKTRTQWGWKEPRTCLWLPAYRQLLPDAFHLVVIRSFNDTVNSLVVREYRLQDAEHDKKVLCKRGLSKLKWHYLKRKRLPYYFKKHAEDFLKTWIYYYEQIIQHCQGLPTENYLLIGYEDLLKEDEYIFQQLKKEGGFSLDFVPFNSIFKKELLSITQTISRFVKDKALLEKAAQLEQHCFALSQNQRTKQEDSPETRKPA